MSGRRPALVVAIGGLDPSGGAGILADVRSIEAMGALPAAVVTAITVQSGTGLRSSRAVAPSLVLAQLDELLDALPVAAIKIGQVPTAQVARALGRRLSSRAIPVVLDPVLAATGGGRLAAPAAVRAIVSSLFPVATLVTVNLDEAAALAGVPVTNLAGMRRAAAVLASATGGAVLVKGGHLRAAPTDLLLNDGRETRMTSRRIRGSMHGSGCALASAAAAALAGGDDLATAVRRAREHVHSLIVSGVRIGRTRFRAPGPR